MFVIFCNDKQKRIYSEKFNQKIFSRLMKIFFKNDKNFGTDIVLE
jgi:hypothetical protein